MRDNPRTTVVSALAGLVLLGGVFTFAVVVPELGDDPAPGSGTSSEAGSSDGPRSTGPVTLPDQVGDLVAVDLGTLPAELAQRLPQPADLKKQEDAIGKGLDGVFDAPGAFRLYAAPDGSALIQVTVLDREPGLFTPDTPPIDPASLGVTRAASELVKVDDAVCSISWGQDVPAGQQVDPAAKPQAVRCQLGSGGRTYEVTAQGLAVDQSVDILTTVAASAT